MVLVRPRVRPVEGQSADRRKRIGHYKRGIRKLEGWP